MPNRFLRISAFLTACLLGFTGCGSAVAPSKITAAVYPDMAAYPNEQEFIDPASGVFDDEGFRAVYDAWRNGKQALRNQPEGYTDGTAAFTRLAAEAFLTGTQDKNAAVSPLNVYLALGMLTEVTEGESREQLLNLLQADSMETLRNRAGSLWNANYSKDGALTSVLASSLWLDEDLTYRPEPLEKLANVYHASAYQGQMGDPAYDAMLREWINEQTGGLLEEAAGNLSMSPETILALAATVYYQAKWDTEFQEENNTERVFHAPAGDIPHTFMHQTDVYGTYYWSENFGAVARRMEEGGQMWFVLPDEGVSMDTVLTDDSLYNLLDPTYDWTDQKTLRVNQYIPKFDISSDADLINGLQALGVTDVFDMAEADFSPLTDLPAAISQVKHAVRVAIDEEGVTAAAFTAMMMMGAARPPAEEMDFILDRPFLFAITGTDGVVLFMGVVNQP